MKSIRSLICVVMMSVALFTARNDRDAIVKSEVFSIHSPGRELDCRSLPANAWAELNSYLGPRAFARRSLPLQIG